ncbi:unnamed protein product [Protopolystoma xenopodis]|uniref:Uncharacterized protein n=1 Tax=Protopolystoma xenopodis TaxID=117903 RepID=A0A448XAN3_9PLAT|nr:unnamed protein product [Protopolystoma xenopodis]
MPERIPSRIESDPLTKPEFRLGAIAWQETNKRVPLDHLIVERLIKIADCIELEAATNLERGYNLPAWPLLHLRQIRRLLFSLLHDMVSWWRYFPFRNLLTLAGRYNFGSVCTLILLLARETI